MQAPAAGRVQVNSLFMLDAGVLQCMQGSVDLPAVAALSKLLSLFGLSFIAREAGDFLEDGYMSGQQVCHCRGPWRDSK